MLGAQQFYIEHGEVMEPVVLATHISNYIPDHLHKSNPDKILKRWEALVAESFQKVR